MATNRLKSSIEILKYALDNKVSGAEACRIFKKSRNYIANSKYEIETMRDNGTISKKEYQEFSKLYEQFLNIPKAKATKKAKPTTKTKITEVDTQPLSAQELADIEYNAETDDSFDERSFGESKRGEDGKIKEYHYSVLIREQPALEGVFSREEMDKVYRLYSNLDGAGLTLRAVSREFSNLTFRDFKRILRAFNITKQSIPIAPHILEEKSEDEILSLIMRNKENNVLRKLEQERGKYIERHLFEAQKTIINIQSEEDWVGRILDKYFSQNPANKIIVQKVTKPISNKYPIQKPTICAFGDIHYGKKFANPVYGRGYNKDIAHERVMQIADYVISDWKLRNSSEIIMLQLGDLVECVMEDGMHPGHNYEMDLYQDEQIFFAIDSLEQMLLKIVAETNCPIQFHSIPGNHDRIGVGRDDDKNRTAGRVIATVISRELSRITNRITFNIPKNNLIRMVCGKTSLFVQHGDSSLSKKKPSELVNLYGEPGCYTVLLQGHWHSLKSEEGTNYTSIKIPSVASTDKFIMEELGNNNLPGFIMGHEPSDCYGFNYSKITLK